MVYIENYLKIKTVNGKQTILNSVNGSENSPIL